MSNIKFLRVPYAQSVHGQAEIDAVVEVLKTSTQMGKNVTKMERHVAEMFHKKYGLIFIFKSSLTCIINRNRKKHPAFCLIYQVSSSVVFKPYNLIFNHFFNHFYPLSLQSLTSLA